MGASIAGLSTAGIRFTRGLPRIALDAATFHAHKLLVLGALAPPLERRLGAAGVRVARTATVLEAQRALAAQTYDAVLVQPEVHGALDLVKLVKLPGHAASLRSASDRHAWVPFFVVPFSGETEYAVIVRPPALAWLEDERTCALADAVLRFDVGRLFKPPGPGATA